MKTKILISVALVASLTACSKEVGFDTIETAKTTARENSMFNAQRYRAENPQFRDWSVVPNGDSTQTPDCPQGDGWATLKLFSPGATNVVHIKCSTVSGATGCLLDGEFKGKPFAGNDGKCQPTTVVPFPIPKIAK